MTMQCLRAALAVLILAASGHARAEEPALEIQIVDAMNKLFGSHSGFRANHAKGVLAEGRFTAAPAAAALSKAALFAGAPIPVTVRFSNSTGVPDLPDGAAAAVPHGMALKFRLPDGGETDMVLNALKFFPVSTGADFRDLLLALADSPPDAAKPTRFDDFLKAHPNVPAALGTAATPASFAEQEYFGVNAFVFVNAAGERQAVRYQMLPERTLHLTAAEAAERPPNFLSDELAERLKSGPVKFRLKAQLAAAGDPTDDAARPWPADRQVVDLGELVIDKLVPDRAAAEKALLFLPGLLTDGIEPSDDPLIPLRDATYAESFARRSQ